MSDPVRSPGFGHSARRDALARIVAGVALMAGVTVAAATSAVAQQAPGALQSVDVPVLTSTPNLDGAGDDSWASAKRVMLTGDFTNRRPVDEPTTVLIAQDANAIDLAFIVTQREAITAVTQTNGAGVLSDDYVGAVFFPNGSQGFQYLFAANPAGSRYQTSSENSAYTPAWQAAGRRSADGYVLTMRIPLDIIRSGGATSWRVQLERATIATNALALWAYSPTASSATDPSFAGTFAGIIVNSAARPKPRTQLYGLGELTSPENGGHTSRTGADISLPVTPTASLVATFHPDFSNVEVDQQTIAPSAFARQYTEVRPFFTQVASPFNASESCQNCPQLLYTPSIPTFRDGYALEGTQGPVMFSAFDAVGYGRVDSAETANYSVSNTHTQYQLDVQRVAVNGADGLLDDTTSINGGYLNQNSHELFFENAAQQAGSAITAAARARSLQTGFGYVTATTQAIGYYEAIGSQFSPVDGYVAQNDIFGSGLSLTQSVQFAPRKLLHDISFDGTFAALDNRLHQPAQNNASEGLDFDFSNLLTLHVYGNETTVRTYDGQFLPFDENGLYAGYATQTSTPTSIRYQGGAYYHGVLDSWEYLTTIPVTKRMQIALETDEDNYLSKTAPGGRAVTWLERASANLQLNRETSFTLGARIIYGENIPNAVAAPNFAPFRAGNLSFALHYLSRDGKSEVYAVYGDPNSLATTPAFYLKLIRYIGAPKGT